MNLPSMWPRGGGPLRWLRAHSRQLLPTAVAVICLVLASAWNRWRWRLTTRQAMRPRQRSRRPSFESLRHLPREGRALLEGAVCLARSAVTQYAVNPTSVIEERVVIAMVGLPARGKSYLSKSIVRYLNFVGCPARLFNAGSRRRDAGLAGSGAAFFDAANEDAAAQREEIAMDTLEELLRCLRVGEM